MAFLPPTVSDFKAQFSRDFPYAVPAWGAAVDLVVTAGVVTGATLRRGGQGYASAPTLTVEAEQGSGATFTVTTANGAVTGVTIVSGGTGYLTPVRGIFTGGAGDDSDLTRVRDTDIEGALFDASYNVSQALFSYEPQYQRAFAYLAAHNLVEKLLAAGEGLVSQYNWLTGSKSVGSMQEAFVIPERISKDPFLASLSKTRYGALYLQIITPLLIGGMFVSPRRTLP